MKPADFNDLPALLDKRQAAYMLHISVTTLDLLRKDHNLRAVKIGGLVRFDTADITDYINRHRSRRRPLDVSHLTQKEI